MSDFGSGGPDDSGLCGGPGVNFFFLFFWKKYDVGYPLVAKISTTDVSELMYTQKMGLKTVFLDLLSLSITEMV